MNRLAACLARSDLPGVRGLESPQLNLGVRPLLASMENQVTERPEHLPPVPPMERYRDVLRIMAYSMPHKHRQLLLKHYRAPGHVATATELAGFVNYPDWNSVNLQYGTFSRRLADRMNWVLPDGAQASYAVAWFEKPEGGEEHWRWHMHGELARALEALGWVTPPMAS